MALRFCKACKDFHSLDEAWPVACYSHFPSMRGVSPQIIRDIEPYRSTVTGERIAGRRQHRDHLKAHGCIEVGNENKPFTPNWDVAGRSQEIKRAVERHLG